MTTNYQLYYWHNLDFLKKMYTDVGLEPTITRYQLNSQHSLEVLARYPIAPVGLFFILTYKKVILIFTIITDYI